MAEKTGQQKEIWLSYKNRNSRYIKPDLTDVEQKPFVDWLQFSLPYRKSSFDYIERVFGFSKDRDCGYRSYSISKEFIKGGMYAFHPDKPENKIHVILSSEALAKQDIDPSLIIRGVVNNKGTFSRVDIALDDYLGFLDMDLIKEKLSESEYISRFRGWDEVGGIESTKKREGKIKKGHTIYLGNRESDTFGRIYDKALQANVEYIWTRLEFEFKGHAANQFCNPDPRLHEGEILTFEDRDFSRTAYYYMRFIDFSWKVIRDENGQGKGWRKTSRKYWKTSEFWTDFLKCAEGEKIGLPKNKISLETIDAWISHQTTGALHLLAKTKGLDYIENLIEFKGQEKFLKNKEYQKIYEQFKEQEEIF